MCILYDKVSKVRFCRMELESILDDNYDARHHARAIAEKGVVNFSGLISR
jgi:hypothetical protein